MKRQINALDLFAPLFVLGGAAATYMFASATLDAWRSDGRISPAGTFLMSVFCLFGTIALSAWCFFYFRSRLGDWRVDLGRCPKCNYDLSHAGKLCPECGFPVAKKLEWKPAR